MCILDTELQGFLFFMGNALSVLTVSVAPAAPRSNDPFLALSYVHVDYCTDRTAS